MVGRGWVTPGEVYYEFVDGIWVNQTDGSPVLPDSELSEPAVMAELTIQRNRYRRLLIAVINGSISDDEAFDLIADIGMQISMIFLSNANASPPVSLMQNIQSLHDYIMSMIRPSLFIDEGPTGYDHPGKQDA